MTFSFLKQDRKAESQKTPTLTGLFKELKKSLSDELKVSMPAEIISIKEYKGKQKIDVRPYFKNKYPDGAELDMPIIYNVPVANLRSESAIISMPLKKGGKVMLLFSDRSLEKWLSSGKRQNPEDTRSHHISDAIAYPGLYPFSESIPLANDTDIFIKNENLEIRVKPNGHLQVFNQSEELVKVLNDMLQIIREAVVYTSTGPQRLRHWRFARIAARLKTFLER